MFFLWFSNVLRLLFRYLFFDGGCDSIAHLFYSINSYILQSFLLGLFLQFKKQFFVVLCLNYFFLFFNCKLFRWFWILFRSFLLFLFFLQLFLTHCQLFEHIVGSCRCFLLFFNLFFCNRLGLELFSLDLYRLLDDFLFFLLFNRYNGFLFRFSFWNIDLFDIRLWLFYLLH